MYNKHKKHQGNRPQNNFYKKASFGNKRMGMGKKLSPHLFVKKASANPSQTDNLTNGAPTQSFSEFTLNESLKRNILTHGYTSPTGIQAQAIPHILEGRDLIGIANTGTGKTASFLIPLVQKVFLNRAERVLIITPTRELALQIADELTSFTTGMNIQSVLCIGGANMYRQEKRLLTGPQFVIGTPGRLKDLIQHKRLHLYQYGNIVLDEVDRMVDIGFINDVKYFISLLPEKRQSLFFSATVSPKVEEILHYFVKNPIRVSVKVQETAENVDQDIIRVNGANKKIEVLHELLTREGFDKVLVFGRTKWGIEKLTKVLLDRGFKVGSLHGNKRQSQRQRVIEEFKHDKIRVLLATDVASRGLDIADITHVINYDPPESYDDYIHRIGRTGRAGKKGVALTFVE